MWRQICHVLYEFKSRFYLAYVACHIRKEGTRSTQFICRDQIGFLGTKVWASRLWLPAILFLDRIFFRHFFVTDEFHLVKDVNGSCSFFVYDWGSRKRYQNGTKIAQKWTKKWHSCVKVLRSLVQLLLKYLYHILDDR